MSMFNGLFRNQDIYGNAYKATKAAEDQRMVVANEPKGIEFKGGEPIITPIDVVNNGHKIGLIRKSQEGLFEYYPLPISMYGIVPPLNHEACVKIAEKLKELNGKDSDNK